MKALLDDKGFITSYALVGDLVDGIDLPDPEDIAHFEEHFAAYKVAFNYFFYNRISCLRYQHQH